MKTTWKPTLGTFSKAIPGSIALNFAESGGSHCSTKCEALKRGVCYAVHTERMKPSIQKSGERKREIGFAACCLEYSKAIAKRIANGKAIPWIRFSTFGSVPNRPLTPDEVKAFVEMVRSFPPGVPVHFPVETPEKADRFRALSCAFDLGLTIRESCQSESRMKACMDKGMPSSRIICDGATKRERLATAQEIARASGGRAAVCPAIASTILKRPQSVKCGQCTLCAQSSRIVILYPQH